MELLYVWIDDYKNIKQQGFCLSAEYDIEYTPKDGTLRIEKRENYVANFWGEQITNLTAIVGENGAGKSTLLELLFRTDINAPISHTEFIIVYGNQVYHSSNLVDCKVELGDEVSISTTPVKIFSLNDLGRDSAFPHIFYSGIYSFNLLRFNSHDLSTTQLMHHSKQSADEAFSTQYLPQLTIYEQEEIKRQIKFLREFPLNQLPEKGHSALPFLKQVTHIDIYFSHDTINFVESDDNKKLKDRLDHFKEANELDGKASFLERFYFRFVSGLIIAASNANGFIVGSKELEAEIKKINEIFNSPKAFTEEEKILEYIKHVQDLQQNKRKNISIDTTYLYTQFPYLGNIIKSFSELIDPHGYVIKFSLNKQTAQILSFVSLGFHTPIFKYQWANENPATTINLSSGEQTILSLMARFYYLLWRKDVSATFEHKEKLLLMIDEGELTLHPEWQRKYLNILLDFFQVLFSKFDNGVVKSVAKQVQIILTTHSPLILSDIPKNNVIFLKKWNKARDEKEHGDQDLEEGNCFVVPQKDTPQTFGANIHTLLAHSFFLQGSLMGEYAKNKINQIIGQLNKSYKSDEEKPDLETLEKHIEIVGEPLLKMQLEKKLVRFKEQTEDTQNTPEQIKQQIEELQKKLNKLEGGNND